jgi:hypothetical protein
VSDGDGCSRLHLTGVYAMLKEVVICSEFSGISLVVIDLKLSEGSCSVRWIYFENLNRSDRLKLD